MSDGGRAAPARRRGMRRLELEIATRYLRSGPGSRLLSFITVIAIGGIVVGVSALLVIVSVMNGLQHELRERILIGSSDVRVLTWGGDLTMRDWERALDSVRTVPGVVVASPFVFTQGLITAGGRRSPEGIHVMGIPPGGGADDVSGIRSHGEQGDFRFTTRSGTATGAVLGARLAERLGVGIGDTVRIISPSGSRVSQALGALLPRVYLFEITGTFRSGLYEYDNSYLYVALRRAQEFAGLGDQVTGLEVRTPTRAAAADVGSAIVERLGHPYRTVDWQEQNRGLFQALTLQKRVMAIILLLIVIVAAFNIVSTLTMVVANKTREIGILRAMGLTARSIRRIFLIQGAVIGIAGTLSGLILGLALATALGEYRLIRINPEVYLIDHLPVVIDPRDTLLILLASAAVAVAATAYPAFQASRLYPVEAIRHE